MKLNSGSLIITKIYLIFKTAVLMTDTCFGLLLNGVLLQYLSVFLTVLTL